MDLSIHYKSTIVTIQCIHVYALIKLFYLLSGNGGSTLTSVQFLADKYGSQLYDMRILLLHAGGQSQRMPSASVLGKIFSPIPKGETCMYQMLDIKLAMYMPLIPLMGPGIFVACADDFLVYDLGSSCENISFGENGFTALAHPSSVSVGTGHGVYVLEDSEAVNPKVPIQVHNCLQVLQKPSETVMYEKGAVLDGKNFEFPPGINIQDKFAYTDSSFFFAHDVTKKFLDYLQKSEPVTCEIDAYGDFLQALGPNATSGYTKNMSNVSTVTENLLKTRLAIFNCLRDTQLTLLLMNASKFVHIGTTKEYIQHFCCDDEFKTEMGLGKDVFNLWDNKGLDHTGQGDNGCPVPSKKSRLSDTSLGCVMHSILPASSYVSQTSVVEYCHFKVPITIGQNCILSNCEYRLDSNLVNPVESLDIPSNIFLHTIPILYQGQTKYVTVYFDIKDNLKKAASENQITTLPFLGKTLGDYTKTCGLRIEKITPNLDDKGVKANLWFSRLFPLVESMSESLDLAVQTIMAVKKDDAKSVSLASRDLMSMPDILRSKDLDTMLTKRNKLFTKIKK